MYLSTGQFGALVAGAVLVFWMVGAYNRLMALRAAIAKAWLKVDEALRQRTGAAQPLLAELRVPLAAEQGTLDSTEAALSEVARTAVAMAASPVAPGPAAAWVAAEAGVAAAASRLFALLEHSAELRQAKSVAAPAAAWRESEDRLRFARQLFNDTAQTYDEAIALFPTRLLIRFFGFRPAGRL